MQNVSFDEHHDLVISRWGLGYLTKDECEAFLLKLNLKLTEGRPKNRPGIAIFLEQFINEDEDETSAKQ